MIDPAVEPAVVLAATPREWAQRLARHVADHGGARIRATVLRADDLAREHFDVFVADDGTSFLSAYLVAELHRRGRAVLGLHDPDDERAKSELTDLGVDAVVAMDAPPEALLRVVAELAREFADAAESRTRADATVPTSQPAPAHDAGRGHVVVVGAPPGGCGATEVAVELTRALAQRQARAALVDADDEAPAIAPRLGLPRHPNLRSAVDTLRRNGVVGADTHALTRDAGVVAVTGLPRPRDRAELRPHDLLALIDALAGDRRHVIVDAGRSSGVDPANGRACFGRHLLPRADAIVGVGLGSPVAVLRLLEWCADVRAAAAGLPLHLVLNQAPANAAKRAQVIAELREACEPASLTVVPYDSRVADAAWDGAPVPRGPFTKAVGRLLDDVIAVGGVDRRGARLVAS